jgi:ABC-type nitrate/sulfonate/bicarbonate transport system permease component
MSRQLDKIHCFFKQAMRREAACPEEMPARKTLSSQALDARSKAERPGAARGRAGGLGARLLSDTRWLSLASVVVGLGLWQWGASHVSGLLLPAPTEVLSKFLDPAWLSRLLRSLGQSLIQLGLGFGLTLVLAVPLGVVIGRSPVLRRMFEPLVTAIYAIPPVAFAPFLVIWFGLFLEARVALVFLMSFFDVLVVMIAGARDVRRPLIDVGRSFGASHGQQLRLIVLPALLPFFVAALRVGSARAINGMVTAELFFAAVNLGGLMKRATQDFDTAAVLSVVVLICLLGLIAQSLIVMLERRLLHWHVRT